jgi:hypothetical protein
MPATVEMCVKKVMYGARQGLCGLFLASQRYDYDYTTTTTRTSSTRPHGRQGDCRGHLTRTAE